MGEPQHRQRRDLESAAGNGLQQHRRQVPFRAVARRAFLLAGQPGGERADAAVLSLSRDGVPASINTSSWASSITSGDSKAMPRVANTAIRTVRSTTAGCHVIVSRQKEAVEVVSVSLGGSCCPMKSLEVL